MPNPHIPHPFGAKHHRFQHPWKSLTSSQAQQLAGAARQPRISVSISSQILGCRIANKQISPQTSWAASTGCEQLPTKTSSSFRKPDPSNPSMLGSCLGAVHQPWRDSTGSPGSRWDRERWGGGSVGEGNLGASEWRWAGGGARAEEDDGTGISQPCPKGKVRQHRWEGKSPTSSGDNSPWSYFLIREKQINGSFTAFSLLRSSKQPHPSPCSSRGANSMAQGPRHSHISQPDLPPASCRQGKAKAPGKEECGPSASSALQPVP